jgi:isoleucyl-tRNA synthetase
MYVQSAKVLDEAYKPIILDELNVKEIEFVEDASKFASYSFKPQLRTLGKKYGKLVPKIGEYLKTNDGVKLMDELKSTGLIKFEVEGQNIELEEADVLIETVQSDDYATESDKGVTVVLSKILTPELIEEGFARELVSKIQTMRKEAGFEVLDRITIYFEGNEKIAQIFADNGESICADTLAVEAKEGKAGYTKDWNINGEEVTLSVEKM